MERLNSKYLSHTIRLEEDSYYLSVSADKEKNDVYFTFSSRLAMYDFAKSLMHDVLFGDGDTTELYPLSFENKLHLANSAKLTLGSSSVFISYPPQKNES